MCSTKYFEYYLRSKEALKLYDSIRDKDEYQQILSAAEMSFYMSELEGARHRFINTIRGLVDDCERTTK